LYRADREWIATDTPGKSAKEIVTTLKRQEKILKTKMKDGLHDKGWSKGRTTRLKGYIPMEFMLAQPELWHDDKARDAFFKEFPSFSTKHNVVK